MLKTFVSVAALLSVLSSAGIARAEDAPAAARPAPGCTEPERHQLDFWLGDWDTFEPEGELGPSQARREEVRTAREATVVCCPYCITPLLPGMIHCPACREDTRGDAAVELEAAQLSTPRASRCVTCSSWSTPPPAGRRSLPRPA